MKKFLFLFLFTLISLCSFSQTNYEYYKQYYRNHGYNIGLEEYADLTQGEIAYTNVNFYSGYTYKIIAMSNDNDVRDVDLFVYLSDGSLFIKDDDYSSLSIVSFDCYFTQRVKIVIKNFSSRTPNYSSRIRYFIAYK